jgi:hypothetical protein
VIVEFWWAQRQLTFEIGDLFLRVSDVFGRLRPLRLTPGQFATESFVLSFQPFHSLRTALPSLGLRHALHGTPVGSICTAP